MEPESPPLPQGAFSFCGAGAFAAAAMEQRDAGTGGSCHSFHSLKGSEVDEFPQESTCASDKGKHTSPSETDGRSTHINLSGDLSPAVPNANVSLMAPNVSLRSMSQERSQQSTVQSESRWEARTGNRLGTWMTNFEWNTSRFAESFNWGSELTATKAFSDQSDLRSRVRSGMMDGSTSTRQFDLYKRHGLCQHIVRNPCFEWGTLTVIALNAIWISIDADLNGAPTLVQADWPFQVADNIFCVLFVLEWSVRFFALHHKREMVLNGWLLFDSLIVSLMVIETWVFTACMAFLDVAPVNIVKSTFLLRTIRLFRVLRLTRLVRLMRACPELMFLVRGMVAATRSVAIAMVLLFSILYGFGVALRQLADDTDMGANFFSTVPQSMYTLLMVGTLLDNVGATVAEIADESLMCAGLFFVVILLAALTVMNMLIGVTCEVVSEVASSEKEKVEVTYLKEQMYQTLWDGPDNEGIDRNHDCLISKEDFRRIIEHPKAFETLKGVGVDVVAMVDMADFIFQSDDTGQDYSKKLDFQELMDIITQLRGSNTATVKDLVDFRRFLRHDNAVRNSAMCRMEERQKAVEARIDTLEWKIDKILAGGRSSHHNWSASEPLSPRRRSQASQLGSPSNRQTSAPASHAGTPRSRVSDGHEGLLT